jgi:DNA-binding helix-hairpin-helix protein with protein kinase domain
VQLFRASNQTPVQLGRELGRGGEGAVYPVNGSPNLVAKIYLKPPTPAKVEKLQTMARVAHPTLLRVAAWPIDVLVDEHQAVRGFLMPKVSAREDVHELYSPKSRKQAFPDADFRFVVRVATNVARAFAQVHAQGHVIGDVNHGNALVGRDGTVVLIDCDSFQIVDKVRIFSCDVGVPLFTPPELQGKSFRGLRRSAQHDAFGLGVLLFHMLFLGRHPFAGRFNAGDMPIERAIAESRFVYGANSAALGMAAPPGTLPLTEFGPKLAELFERTFAAPGTGDRPSATQWVGALKQLEDELARCPVSRVHYHHKTSACCWCSIEQRTGVRLFGGKAFDADPLGVGNIDELWGAISAVPAPEAVPEYQPTLATTTAMAKPVSATGGSFPRVVLSWVVVGLGATLLLIAPGKHPFLAFMCFAAAAVMRAPWKLGAGGNGELAEHLQRAERRWHSLVERWNAECTALGFEDLRAQLAEARTQLQNIPRLRQARLRELESRVESTQRDLFLDRFPLAKKQFASVRSEEIAMLASYGIETAADVIADARDLESMVTRGAANELLAWARALSDSFTFDPNQPVDPREVARLDEILGNERAVLLAKLRAGPDLLARKHEEIAAARAELKGHVDEAWRELTRARESQ